MIQYTENGTTYWFESQKDIDTALSQIAAGTSRIQMLLFHALIVVKDNVLIKNCFNHELEPAIAAFLKNKGHSIKVVTDLLPVVDWNAVSVKVNIIIDASTKLNAFSGVEKVGDVSIEYEQNTIRVFAPRRTGKSKWIKSIYDDYKYQRGNVSPLVTYFSSGHWQDHAINDYPVPVITGKNMKSTILFCDDRIPGFISTDTILVIVETPK